jgi:lysophosphatidate acyltransferase
MSKAYIGTTVVVGLVIMGTFFSKTKFVAKSIIYGVLVAACALYGVVISAVLRIFGKTRYAQYLVARAFYACVSKTLGYKINIKNSQYLDSNPAIYVLNHQSALDVFVLGKLFQPGFTVTSKKSLKYIPFLGWFMLLSGTFFIDRSKGEKAKAVLNSALGNLTTTNSALVIFPEGTRAAKSELELLPFKKGAFHLAKQAGIPIVPIVVSNTSTLFHAKTKVFEPGTINIEVLKPVSTEGIETNEDVTKLTDQVRSDMMEAYKRVGFAIPKNKPHSSPAPSASALAESVDETTPLVK